MWCWRYLYKFISMKGLVKIMGGSKRLYKSRKNRMICGVCAGIAEYLNVDVTIIRLLVVVLSGMAFSGVVAYFVAAFIMPEE